MRKWEALAFAVGRSGKRRARAICVLESREERRLGPPVRVWGALRSDEYLADVVCADDAARRALVPAILAHMRRNPKGRLLMALGPMPVDSVLLDEVRGSRAVKLGESIPHADRLREFHPFDTAPLAFHRSTECVKRNWNP